SARRSSAAPQGAGSTTSRACPRSRLRRTSLRSTTGGSGSELHGDPVVDAAEDEGAERERGSGRGREVDDVEGMRQPAEEERIAHGIDRRRDEVAIAEDLLDGVIAVELLEPVEDRRQEEPRQEQRADEVLDVAEDDVRGR